MNSSRKAWTSLFFQWSVSWRSLAARATWAFLSFFIFLLVASGTSCSLTRSQLQKWGLFLELESRDMSLYFEYSCEALSMSVKLTTRKSPASGRVSLSCRFQNLNFMGPLVVLVWSTQVVKLPFCVSSADST